MDVNCVLYENHFTQLRCILLYASKERRSRETKSWKWKQRRFSLYIDRYILPYPKSKTGLTLVIVRAFDVFSCFYMITSLIVTFIYGKRRGEQEKVLFAFPFDTRFYFVWILSLDC